MEWLAQDPRTIFIGQAVEVPGTAMSNTVKDIPLDRRIELPVAEEMQMGMTVGLAMQGQVPVSIYPRWNFMILRHYALGSIEDWHTAGFVAYAIDLFETGLEIGLQEIVQGINAFIEQDEIDERQREHFLR